MYDSAAVPGLVGLIRGGLLHLGQWAVTEFPLADVNEAVTHAASEAGPFKLTVINPQS
jgi:alcohol dehydrogenase